MRKASKSFATIDSKKECLGYFYDGELFSEPSQDHCVTWSYHPRHHSESNKYIKIFLEGKDLEQACPEHLRAEWDMVSSKKSAFLKSMKCAQVDVDNVCMSDLLPSWFMREYFQTKCDIMDWVFENTPEPTNYTTKLSLEQLFYDIRERELNLDFSEVRKKAISYAARQQLKKVTNTSNKVSYNQFGSITGRLTVEKGSFPILNLPKDFRRAVLPKNDYFVEFDYNAAELRMLMALLGADQPEEDIHEWNIKNIFNERCSRDEAKRRIFSWLYNPSHNDEELGQHYDKSRLLSEHWDGNAVTTPYNRRIDALEHHALNYLIQSTTSDLVLEQVLKVYDYLKEKQSEIAFLIHDSFVLDIPKEERYNIPEIAKIFSCGRFGHFRVGVKAGKDFGNLKEIKL